MSIYGAKSIAEYAVRKWLSDNYFIMEYFTLKMNGNEGVLTDNNDASMTLVYHPESKSVQVKGD